MSYMAISEAPEEKQESFYSKCCPQVALVVVHGAQAPSEVFIKVLGTMGAYFEQRPEDTELIETQGDPPDDGVFIVELEFFRGDGWTTDDDVIFNFRALTDEERERWLKGDDPWPDEWWAKRSASSEVDDER